ncbi:DUF3857 domain-containing protein [Chryseobacterium herbae]|uniref:DUF3857 and transglutaminase domain-containing protein n=1 Tax=Chryseobacterium herbae TaxID=2976476 RepID=A0ABT2IPE9_9FLAO|nr:DUF3857 domain-containing protein [Chryseobacterium sp. pc1-10]MCT2560693.1 DUF3857 and transglutaminase domain-containing protein [Chryseobacterium sp. pc1-10]
MRISSKLNTAICCLAFNLFFTQHKFLVQPAFDEADLKKTNSLIEKTAPAEILYNSVRYNFLADGTVEKEYYSKIKIYDKKNAEEWLNIEIPLFSEDKLEKYDVKIYNLANNKVDKISIDKKEQLKENFTKGLKIYKLAVPNILDGSIIEYSYKLVTKNVVNLNYFLEYNIPVIYQEYNLEYPDDRLAYHFNNTGSITTPKYHVSSIEDRFGALYNVFRFGYENIKSVQKEKFVKNVDRYRGKVKPELKKYSGTYFSYFDSKDWNEVAKQLDKSDDFGGFLRSNVNDLLPEKIKTGYGSVEKADKIFNFVKDHYKWNREDAILTSQSLKQLIKTKAGNSAEINLLLIMLLRNAGIEANPLLISTVDNGILNIASPSLRYFNFLLASVKIENQIYFYDATSFSSKANILPERDWNDFGILLEKNKGTDLSYSNTNISKKEQIIKASLDIENSTIKGTFLQKDHGMFAIESYDEFDTSKDKYNQSFASNYNADIKEVESKLLENGDFESQMAFSGNSFMDVVGNKVVINPVLFLNTKSESFDQPEARKNQIDFISAFEKEKRIELVIPENYKILSLPKDKKMATDDKEISYTYKVETTGNKIIITSKVNVASQNYPKEYYPFFKQIWKAISDFENQVITLEKK